MRIPEMHKCVGMVASFAVILAGCRSDEVVAPSPSLSELAPYRSHSLLDTVDIGSEFREQLRALSDDEFRQSLATSRSVIIGFKEPSETRGVSHKGAILTSADLIDAMRKRTALIPGARVLRDLSPFPAIVAELPSVDAVSLRTDPRIDYIVPNGPPASFDAPPAVAACSWQPQTIAWFLNQIRAVEAWQWSEGQGLTRDIAIIDDGWNFGPKHPTEGLEVPVARMVDLYGPGSGTPPFHGTYVAGVVGARNNGIGVVGVAPRSKIAIYRVSEASAGAPPDPGVVMAAIVNTAGQSAVVNMSFSIPTSYPQPPAGWAAVNETINWAYGVHGVVFVASTGNSESSSTYRWPAGFPNVIGVSGTNYGDNPHVGDYAVGNVELAAPSLDIDLLCAGGGGPTIGSFGTSFATPQVAAAAYLIRTIHQTWSADQVRMRLRSTAAPAYTPGFDLRTGYGRLDVLKAVQVIQPPPAFSAEISGQNPIPPDIDCSWVASVTAGQPPYSFQWYRDGSLVSLSDSYTGGLYGGTTSFALSLSVVDALGAMTGANTVIQAGEPGPACLLF